MNGYCDRCDNHCAIDHPRCERGAASREREAGFGEGGRRGGGFRTLPAFPGEGMEGFHTLPAFPEDGFDGFHTLPARPGEGRRFDESHGGPRRFDGEGFRGGRPPFGGHHGGFGGPGRGGMPPHGRPPFGGRPPRPMPSEEALRERVAEADLEELIRLSDRLMPHRPGMGSARGQTLILSILVGREDLSQRELQQMLGIQPGSMSEIVSKLEKKGLLTREKGEDRRGNLLRITEAGRQAIPTVARMDEDELFRVLDEQERTTLSGLLRKLLNDWVGRVPAHRGEAQGPEGTVQV